jgi:hypothetical protein
VTTGEEVRTYIEGRIKVKQDVSRVVLGDNYNGSLNR